MIPASRAACSGSPFFTCPVRISRRATADIDTCAARHRLAVGDRLVAHVHHARGAVRPDMRQLWLSIGFPARPRPRSRSDARLPTLEARVLVPTLCPLRQIEREALERHRQVHALQLHARRHLERAR